MRYLTAVALVILFQTGCSFSPGCEESMALEAKSPDEQMVARHFLRNCGATTGYSSIVRVSIPTELNRAEDEVFVVSGDRQIRLHWMGNKTLQLLCDDCSDDRVFKRLPSVNGVSIVYR